MQQKSNYSEVSSSSAQCGMCGSCGGMPPWAPEVISKATPAQRQALEHRLSEARKRFIAARDARLAAAKPATQKDEPKLSSDNDEKDTEINHELKEKIKSQPEEVPKEEKPFPPTDVSASKKPSVGKENTPAPDQHQLLQQPQHKTENQSKQSNVAVLQPENSRKSSAPVKQTNSLSASSLTELESDADSFHTADDEELDDKFELASTDIKNDGVTMKSDELRYMSIPIETTAEKTAFSEKPRPGSCMERYHTSSSSNAPSQSADNIPEPVSFDDIDDNTNKESEWTPFKPQTNPDANTNTRNLNTAGSTNPITDALINPQTGTNKNADSTMAIQELSPGSVGETADTWTSDNLEQILLTQSSLQNRPRRPSATAFSSRANDDVNSDALRIRPELPVLTPPPSRHSDKDGRRDVQCADCQAWKGRVIQLEAKLESLSSSLAIREMEVATLKSQIDQAGRYVPKSEARLMQECESLRVTTEFLFQKLERYERSLNGRKGDVH